MQTMTLEQFHTAIHDQGVPIEHVAMKCPKCGKIQSATDLVAAGAGPDFDAVEKYLGFSCVGRFTDTSGCNWTLGGLFQIHTFEVETPDGERHPRFELATPEEAKAHMEARSETSSEGDQQ